MTGTRTSASVVALAACLVLWSALLIQRVQAQGAGRAEGASDTVRFEIPAQALDTALEQYGALSGRPVFFDASLVAGRTSTALHGMYAPQDALRILLDGTGLTADYAGTGESAAFVLRAVDPAEAVHSLPAGGDADSSPPLSYDGLMQTRIREAFCDSPLAEPGGYRTAIRFNVDPQGRVTNPRLLHSTGDRDRDMAILVILQHVQLDEAPPPDMAQPIYMVILPRESTSRTECRPRP